MGPVPTGVGLVPPGLGPAEGPAEGPWVGPWEDAGVGPWVGLWVGFRGHFTRKHTLPVRLRCLRLPRRPQPGNGKHILEHRPRFLSLLRILRIRDRPHLRLLLLRPRLRRLRRPLRPRLRRRPRRLRRGSSVLRWFRPRVKKCQYCRTSNFKFFFENTTLNDNYSPKWRWLATDTEVNNGFSIY